MSDPISNLRSLADELDFLWRNYAKADEEELAPDAQRLKQHLLEVVDLDAIEKTNALLIEWLKKDHSAREWMIFEGLCEREDE